MKKSFINYIVIIAIITITFWIISTDEGLKNFPKVIQTVEIRYIYYAIISMIMFLLLDGKALHMLTKIVNKDITYYSSFRTTMIGQYYMNITPLSSGGPPALLFFMRRDSIGIGEATSVIMMKYIINEFILTIYILFSFIYNYSYVIKDARVAFPFLIIGILVNILVIVLIILAFYNATFVKKISLYILKLLNKMKKFESIEKWQNKLLEILDEYELGINKIKENKLVALKTSLLDIVKLSIYFSITYFVYKSFEVDNKPILDVMLMQPLLDITVSYMPTPGRAGAAEAGFFVFFKSLYRENTIVLGLLVWRVITYYFRLIITGVFVLSNHIRKKDTIYN